MKGKKKWIVIAVIVLLALFGAIGGKGSDKAPKDNSEPVQEQTAGVDEEQTADVNEEQTGEAETPDVSDEEQESEAEQEGISTELKEFLDSYEAFMDEYCEFMKNYNDSDPAQLLKYASLMEKYYEFSEKAEAWDEENMTDEELLYYVQVMNRVNEKLLETEVAVG